MIPRRGKSDASATIVAATSSATFVAKREIETCGGSSDDTIDYGTVVRVPHATVTANRESHESDASATVVRAKSTNEGVGEKEDDNSATIKPPASVAAERADLDVRPGGPQRRLHLREKALHLVANVLLICSIHMPCLSKVFHYPCDHKDCIHCP